MNKMIQAFDIKIFFNTILKNDGNVNSKFVNLDNIYISLFINNKNVFRKF